jgi:hypothetical protein
MFAQAFDDAGCGMLFSEEARALLFEYFSGYDIELDVFQLANEYAEHSVRHIAAEYAVNSNVDSVREYLSDRGVLVGQTRRGFIYAVTGVVS